jgi:hypothetical protein
MKTIKQFCLVANTPEELTRATIRQIGGWGAFKDRASDVAKYGANNGESGFTWYTDTVAFTKKNRAFTLAYAEEQADSLGLNLQGFLESFRCLEGVDVMRGLYDWRSEDRQTVYNALAWFALEAVAQAYKEYAE